MTPRSIRRAAERKAQKAARKAALHGSSTAASTSEPIAPPPARLAANRPAAQPAAGRTVLLAAHDTAAYEAHVATYEHELQPVGAIESALVQSLADTAWRIDRLIRIEMALFAMPIPEPEDAGDSDSAPAPEAMPAALPPELRTFLTYEKQLRSLHIQEARLQRRREKDMAELRRLQQERAAREESQLATPAPDTVGFEFSSVSSAPLAHRAPHLADRSHDIETAPRNTTDHAHITADAA